MKKKISIEVSAKHVHLSKKHLEVLFGKGYQLSKLKKLSQPGEFAAKETVDIQNKGRKISNVRIIGPPRRETQVELSHTDIIFLKMQPIVRNSGDIKGTPGAILIGPKKKIKIKEGVINTWRHIHCNLKEAKEIGLKDKMLVSVETTGKCAVVFQNVKVKINNNCSLCMHVDTDEGNAACITKKGDGYLLL